MILTCHIHELKVRKKQKQKKKNTKRDNSCVDGWIYGTPFAMTI